VSERNFRLVQGLYLILALYLEIDILIYLFMGVMIFECLTNWRVPIIVSRIWYGNEAVDASFYSESYKFNYEAERLIRFVVALFLYIGFVLYPDIAWFLPWFVGVMLLMAGVTNICPMVMFFRYLGFR
jgi:hypothetical protein